MTTTDSTTTKTGLGKIGTICIPTNDQAKAKAFYVDALGLEIRMDVPFGEGAEGMFWIELGVPGQLSTIALAPPPPGQAADGGMQTGIIFETADIEAVHANLKAAGVDVDAEISRMGDPVPPMFWFRDPEANVLMVAEASR